MISHWFVPDEKSSIRPDLLKHRYDVFCLFLGKIATIHYAQSLGRRGTKLVKIFLDPLGHTPVKTNH